MDRIVAEVAAFGLTLMVLGVPVIIGGWLGTDDPSPSLVSRVGIGLVMVGSFIVFPAVVFMVWSDALKVPV